MPIELPDLDNRSYADLVDEAVKSIPDLHPGWTDHNPSNPGIALIELLGWLTEMVVYRTNQIPQRNYEVFLKLLNGKLPGGDWWELPAGQDLDTAIRDTLRSLRERYRAVTAEDYEYLVANTWPGSSDAAGLEADTPQLSKINRSHCLPEYNLDKESPAGARGYITLLVVPEGAAWLSPLDPKLTTALQSFFKDRKVLTTLLHVTAPVYVVVDVSATIFLKDDADHDDVMTRATQALADFFHPTVGGADGRGWPFGRAVHASDVYTVLDQVSGIDYVDAYEDPVTHVVTQAVGLTAPGDPVREVPEAPGSTVITAVTLMPWELVKVQAANIHLTMIERRGGKWLPIS